MYMQVSHFWSGIQVYITVSTSARALTISNHTTWRNIDTLHCTFLFGVLMHALVYCFPLLCLLECYEDQRSTFNAQWPEKGNKTLCLHNDHMISYNIFKQNIAMGELLQWKHYSQPIDESGLMVYYIHNQCSCMIFFNACTFAGLSNVYM